MASTSRASPSSSKGLRQRMNYLAGQAQSKVSQMNHSNQNESQRPESPSPSGSGSGSIEREEEEYTGSEEESEPEEYDEAEATPGPSPARPQPPKRISLPVRERTVSGSELPLNHEETPWYADPTLMPLLVSAFFSWLTGGGLGDVIRNLFMLVLSGWWLWQVREVPWRLYLSSRPRKSALPPPSSPEDQKYKQLAESELQSLELLFLVLTLISPLFGAILLRTMSSTLSGEELSWFSTSLFVMASAWRPWSHFIERIKGRVEGLHDLAHFPPIDPHSPAAGSPKDPSSAEELEQMKKRLADLEKSLTKLKERMSTKLEDVYDYVDESVEPVVEVVKKIEKRIDSAPSASGFSGKGKARERPLLFNLTSSSSRQGKEEGRIMQMLRRVVPEWVLPAPPSQSPTRTPPAAAASSPSRRPSYHQSHPSSGSDRLETILEEPASSQPPPYVAPRKNNVGFIRRVINGITNIITFPFRVVLGLIWKVF